jgi:hypothetical protein
MNKLPRELLLDIITKQNSTEYLNADECQLLIKKAQKRLNQISFNLFKEFFTLSEDFYKYIDGIDIQFELNRIELSLGEGDIYIDKYKNDIIITLRYYYQNSNKKLMDELVDFLKENKESSYEFLRNLKKNSTYYIIEIDFP